MIRLFLLLFVTSLYASEIPNPLESNDQDFDIQHYQLDISFDDENPLQITASTTITFNWVNDDESRFIRFNLRDLNVDQVFLNDKEIDISTHGEPDDGDFHYYYIVNSDFQVENNLVVYYSGLMGNEGGPNAWGGVHFSQNYLYAMGVGFRNNYVSTTQHWLACFDHPTDKATVRFKFTLPQEKFVASVGKLVYNEIENGKRVQIWESKDQIATYLCTFAMNEYEEMDFFSNILPDLPINVYATANDTTACRFSFGKLPEMVEVFSEKFGDYPFEKVGNVITPLGAMEHQTMVCMPRDRVLQYFQQRDSTAPVVAHELAHHWFGNLVTCRDFRHAWLNESFATFCENIWYESFLGKVSYVKLQANKGRRYLNGISVQEGVIPLYDFPRENPSSNYPQTIYQKGAVVFGMLRDNMGDENFFNAVNDYLTTFRDSTATTNDLLNSILPYYENAQQFFNQWVYGKGWPIITIDYYESNGLYYLKTNQIQDTEWGVFKDVKFEIEYSSSSTQEHIVELVINEKEQIHELPALPDGDLFRFNISDKLYSLIELESVTSTKDLSDNFTFYPNPTNEYINIETNLSGKVSLIDGTGTEVLTKDISGDTKISVKGLKGFHFLVFRTNNNYYSKKIIINE